MDQIKDFIFTLKKDYQYFGNIVKSYLKNYIKVKDFFKDLFHWIPIDFFIILFCTLVLLILISSISRKNPKFNLLLSFFVTSSIWLFLSSLLLSTPRYTYILISMLILFIFGFVFYLIDLAIHLFVKYIYKKRLGNPRTLERSLYNLQTAYNESMAQAYLVIGDKDYNLAELKERLNNLKIASEGMLTLLEKKYKQ